MFVRKLAVGEGRDFLGIQTFAIKLVDQMGSRCGTASRPFRLEFTPSRWEHNQASLQARGWEPRSRFGPGLERAAAAWLVGPPRGTRLYGV